MGTKKGQSAVFLREATGLVKDVGFFDVIAYNLGDQTLGASLAVIGFTMILLPTVAGVNLVYASIIAFLLALPQAVVYSMMQMRISRTGGEYVWISRMFGGFIGSVITFGGQTLEWMPFQGLIALSAVFSIGSAGLALGYQNSMALAVAGSAPLAQFLIAALLYSALIGLNVVRPKYAFKLLSLLVGVGIVVAVLSISLILNAGTAGVSSYINSLGAGVSYSQITSSYSGPTFDLGATLSMVPYFAFFVYPWFTVGASIGSEIKGKSALRWNAFAALLISFVLMTAAIGTMYYVAGYQFTNAALGNSNLVNNFGFSFWTLAMGVSNNAILRWVIAFGWIAWEITVMLTGIIVISRFMLAQAFDRFLPSKLAYVSPRSASPVVAHLVDLVITLVVIAAAVFFYGSLVSLYAASISAFIYVAFAALAAVVYAQRNDKGLSRMTLELCGILTAIVFVYYTYTFLAAPAIWGGNGIGYAYAVASFVGGVVIYFVSKAYHARQGVDITLAFKQIPPE